MTTETKAKIERLRWSFARELTAWYGVPASKVADAQVIVFVVALTALVAVGCPSE